MTKAKIENAAEAFMETLEAHNVEHYIPDDVLMEAMEDAIKAYETN